MPTESAILGLCWNASAASTVHAKEKWVLGGMQKHGPAMVTMLWWILGNEQDVCDVYQDTFLRLSERTGKDKPRNVKAFLFRTASNVAISVLRRRKTHAKACRVVAETAPREHHVDYGSDLDARRLREHLRACMAKLPERVREVVILKDLAEMPYAQIAKALDMSVVTARVYRYRGIRQLAAWMARDEDT